MSTQQDLPPGGGPRQGWFVTFITSLPGILTASASVIAAIGGAFYGGTRVGQHDAATPTTTVTVTRTVSASAAPSDSTSGTPSPATTGQSGGTTGGTGASPTAAAFLSSLQALNAAGTGSLNTGPVQFLNTQYQNSVRFSCWYGTSTVTYEVAGFGVLDVSLGIPSDATNGAGNTATFTFSKDGSTKELGTPIAVTVGSPRHIRLPLEGSTQLEISCKGTNTTDVALGTATLLPS